MSFKNRKEITERNLEGKQLKIGILYLQLFQNIILKLLNLWQFDVSMDPLHLSEFTILLFSQSLIYVILIMIYNFF